MSKNRFVVAMLAVCLASFGARAEIGEAVGFHKRIDNEVEEKQWSEESVDPPAYPREADLTEFYVGAATSNRFFVDGTTLHVGKDGIVRYVLVVRTSGGATNVTFEGIHCQTREYKIYASGRKDGTWAQAVRPVWRPIENKLVNRHHAALNRDLLCPIGNPINTADEGRDALRRGKHPLVP